MRWRNHQTPRKLRHRSQKTSPQPASDRDKGSAGTAVMHDSDATSTGGTAVTEDTWLNPASLWDLNTFTFGGTVIPHHRRFPLRFFLRNWPSSLHMNTYKVFPPHNSALTTAQAVHAPELLCVLPGISVWSQALPFFNAFSSRFPQLSQAPFVCSSQHEVGAGHWSDFINPLLSPRCPSCHYYNFHRKS